SGPAVAAPAGAGQARRADLGGAPGRAEHREAASGGLLSRGHPLGATGPRQVRRHRVGLVETMGGGAAGMDGNACVVTILAAQDYTTTYLLPPATGSDGRGLLC